MEVEDRENRGHKRAFWFARGGSGFCICRALANKTMPCIVEGEFMALAERTGAPDDCIVGYIINYLLHTNLTVIQLFHSHLEKSKTISNDNLGKIRLNDIKEQITLSYYRDSKWKNIVTIEGFSQERILQDSCPFTFSVSTLANMYIGQNARYIGQGAWYTGQDAWYIGQDACCIGQDAWNIGQKRTLIISYSWSISSVTVFSTVA